MSVLLLRDSDEIKIEEVAINIAETRRRILWIFRKFVLNFELAINRQNSL